MFVNHGEHYETPCIIHNNYYIIFLHIYRRQACRWQSCLLATAHHTQYAPPRPFVYAVLQNLLCSGGTVVAQNESTSGFNAIRPMARSVHPTAAAAANGSRVPACSPARGTPSMTSYEDSKTYTEMQNSNTVRPSAATCTNSESRREFIPTCGVFWHQPSFTYQVKRC